MVLNNDGDFEKDTDMTTMECEDDTIEQECKDMSDMMSTTKSMDDMMSSTKNMDDENPDEEAAVGRFETVMAIFAMIFCSLWM